MPAIEQFGNLAEIFRRALYIEPADDSLEEARLDRILAGVLDNPTDVGGAGADPTCSISAALRRGFADLAAEQDEGTAAVMSLLRKRVQREEALRSVG
jgi:hypothetical protein